MKAPANTVLTLNGGSSSIKFSFYEKEESLRQLFYGEMENIGLNDCSVHCINRVTGEKYTAGVKASNHTVAATIIIDWLERQNGFGVVQSIGHRVVQGMTYRHPELISDGLMVALNGFHGLSYADLLEELGRLSGSEAAKGRIILAHLGAGASLAAVKDGKSMDTSMGFSPASGLPMSTRTGDLDPGVAWYLMEIEKLSPAGFSHLVHHESGLLGISETSPDMRELVKIMDTDHRAAEAIDLFCYQTRKWIGAFATVLGGVDTLVFSGGIGENAPEIRRRICENLGFLGVELDEGKNMGNEAVISSGTGKVSVRVMRTNEEVMIARLVCQVLQY